MKLTCVTATFNCIKAGNRERLIRCVESVAKLKTEHEHLIYDGASTDGTADLLRELEAKTPGLKVVSEPDTGIYNALNKGVRDAKGEWFYVLGSDDYISHPEILDSLICGIDSTTKVIVAPIERDGMDPYFTGLADLKRILMGVAYSHQGVIVKTDTMREFGGFDETYRIAADGDLFFRMHKRALCFRYTFRPFTNFFLGGVCMTNFDATQEEVSRIMAKHLNIYENERIIAGQKGYWPLRAVLPFLFHRDLALRTSAWHFAFAPLKRRFRRVLRPFVVVIRSVTNLVLTNSGIRKRHGARKN